MAVTGTAINRSTAFGLTYTTRWVTVSAALAAPVGVCAGFIVLSHNLHSLRILWTSTVYLGAFLLAGLFAAGQTRGLGFELVQSRASLAYAAVMLALLALNGMATFVLAWLVDGENSPSDKLRELSQGLGRVGLLATLLMTGLALLSVLFDLAAFALAVI